MSRTLARAWLLFAACPLGVGVSACSLVLDWTGYTDGGFGTIDANDDASIDASDADAAAAHDATPARDALPAPDAAPVDAGVVEASPRCDTTTCGGCCNSNGFCSGGGSATTCGTRGDACQDCSRLGQSCDQGACAAIDSGPAPVCDEMVCRSMITLCIPVYDSPCCRSDGTCGCQVAIPPGACM